MEESILAGLLLRPVHGRCLHDREVEAAGEQARQQVWSSGRAQVARLQLLDSSQVAARSVERWEIRAYKVTWWGGSASLRFVRASSTRSCRIEEELRGCWLVQVFVPTVPPPTPTPLLVPRPLPCLHLE